MLKKLNATFSTSIFFEIKSETNLDILFFEAVVRPPLSVVSETHLTSQNTLRRSVT